MASCSRMPGQPGRAPPASRRRRRDRFEIDQRLAQRLVHLRLPALGRDEGVVSGAPADALGPRLLPLALADHDGDVEPHQRAHVAGAAAVGADDLHRLPFAQQRRITWRTLGSFALA